MGDEQDQLVGVTIRDYVLVRLLGRGAMGSVYLGRHQQSQQEVAIKFLAGEFSNQPQFVSRFNNEALASAALDHENVIRVYEAGQDEGLHFIVMEFVDGVSLATFMHAKESQVLPWLKQSAVALAYAHSKGIIHRDLKPENIMLTNTGQVKIADLGLSKNTESQENMSLTMSGTVIGTPYYISPEQVRDAKRVDARTDIYSLGATFYHLVTGVPPFLGDSAAVVMAMHMNDQLVAPQRKNSTLSDGFNDLIMKMMEKDPSKRFQTMDEVVEALGRLERGEAVIQQKVRLRRTEVAEPTAQERSSWLSLRHWKLGVAGAVVLVIFGLFVMQPGGKQPPKPTVPPSQIGKVAPPPGGAIDVPPVQSPDGATNSPPIDPATGASPSVTVPPNPGTQDPESEETPLVMPKSGVTDLRNLSGAFNWLDAVALAAMLIGVPMATPIGWIWASIRAAAFWVAVVVVCYWLGDFASWIKSLLTMPEDVSIEVSFFVLSIITMLPAWVVTHRLIGHQRETWQLKLNRTLAMVPGLALGAAIAVWFIALLTLTGGATLPLNGSWVGSKILSNFPAVQPIKPAK